MRKTKTPAWLERAHGREPATLSIGVRFYGSCLRGFSSAAEADKILVSFAGILTHRNDRRSDQIPIDREMYLGLFITASQHFHLDSSAGKIDLDVELQFVTNKIFLLDADRGREKSDPCAAKIDGLAGNRSIACELSLASVVYLRFEPHTHWCGIGAARSN